MFMITIGDLYKFQPIVLKSVTINIPDDASWETMNEINNPLEEWNYLNQTIRSKLVGKNYAQLPKEVEIAITCDVLEKDRAIVGNANFGHAPFTDDYIKGNYIPSDKNSPFLPEPTEFHKNMVEYNGDADTTLDLEKRIDVEDSNPTSTVDERRSPQGEEPGLPVQDSQDPTKLPTTSGAKAGRNVV